MMRTYWIAIDGIIFGKLRRCRNVTRHLDVSRISNNFVECSAGSRMLQFHIKTCDYCCKLPEVLTPAVI